MAINLTKVLTQIQNRISDSTTNARDLNKLIAAASRINNSGTQVLTYQSTGQLPSLADSSYIGVIARVTSDNVFGDSDGRYYYASGTDSGWRGFKTTQDSADALIEDPSAAGGGSSATAFTVASINGSAYGYRQGGLSPYTNRIDKYSFTSDGNATDVGDLASNHAYMGSSSTNDHGYSMGGWPYAATQKYSHTSDGNATAIPGLATNAYWCAGHTSDTNVYLSMFYNALTPTIGSSNWNDDIGKAPIASEDAWSAVTTTWSNTIGGSTSQMAQSYTDAYAAGGVSAYPVSNPAYDVIEKFPFASEGTTTDVGDLSTVRLQQSHNSYENNYGYSAGGRTNSPAAKTNVIEKYPFASSGNATDVGDLLGSTDTMGSTNSTASGYAHGGLPSQNVIQKFSFTSDGNATDVGDLLDSKYHTGGSQV